MPLLLYRYILREMFKHLLASLSVLVVVMSFGFAIKPISEGLLGPLELIRVVLYVMPGMAALAMPFAAAFAGTMVFFRMSQDNEVAACATSGISYVSLLLPVSLVGLGLTLLMFLMSNWVVPLFWQQVSQILEQDVARLMIHQLDNRESVRWKEKGLVLYADQSDLVTDLEPTDPDAPRIASQMRLRGVAVGVSDPRERTLRSVHTAELAVVNFYHEDGRIFVTLKLTDVMYNDPDTGALVRIASLPIETYEIESPFQQQPKFMSLSDLRRVAREPDRSREVTKLKLELWETMAEHITAQVMRERLLDDTQRLTLLDPQDRRHLIQAPVVHIDGNTLVFPHRKDAVVRVRIQHEGLIRESLIATSSRAKVERDDFTREPRITFVLDEVTMSDQALATDETQRIERRISRLRIGQEDPVTEVLERLRRRTAQEMLRESAGLDHAAIVRASNILKARITKLHRDIVSRVHERAASAVCAILALVLASVISMKMRHQPPLAIFFWSFLPTIVAILMISSGQNLIYSGKFGQWSGIAVIWGGNGLILLMALNVYRQLRRN